ncbi:hypothetical protein P7C73_g370, partial [Tremellales sp. Uapishka_1]
MVHTIALSDGKKIPFLAWGNGTGDGKTTPVELGVTALKGGITHIDTAQIYGTQEETTKSINEGGFKRSDIWITSKIGKLDGPQSPESIKKVVYDSVKKIGSPPDLYLIHNPFLGESGKLGEFWQVLEGLVEDGTLKGTSLGVSNFRPQDLEEVLKVAKIKPVVNQVEYHPYVLEHLDPVTKLQEAHGIIYEAYGPLTPVLRHKTGGPLKPVLEKIAKTLSQETGKEVDEAGVLLLWTRGKGVVAVTSSGKKANIAKMVALDDVRDLTSAEMAEIEETGRKVHFRHYVSRSASRTRRGLKESQQEHMNKDYPSPNLPDGL